MAATHYELRKAFMENFKATTKQHELVLMGAYSVAILQGVAYMRLGNVNEEAGIDSKFFDPKRDEKAIKLAFDGYSDIQQCAKIIYKLFGDNEKNFIQTIAALDILHTKSIQDLRHCIIGSLLLAIR